MDCCIASFDGDDAEPINPCTISTPTAHKEHVCQECFEPIKVGEKYERVEGKCDDRWFSHKTCVACLRVRKQYFCGGWTYGTIWEDLKYALDNTWVENTEHDAPEDESWLPDVRQSRTFKEKNGS